MPMFSTMPNLTELCAAMPDNDLVTNVRKANMEFTFHKPEILTI